MADNLEHDTLSSAPRLAPLAPPKVRRSEPEEILPNPRRRALREARVVARGKQGPRYAKGVDLEGPGVSLLDAGDEEWCSVDNNAIWEEIG